VKKDGRGTVVAAVDDNDSALLATSRWLSTSIHPLARLTVLLLLLLVLATLLVWLASLVRVVILFVLIAFVSLFVRLR
jgi:hypothetical protein